MPAVRVTLFDILFSPLLGFFVSCLLAEALYGTNLFSPLSLLSIIGFNHLFPGLPRAKFTTTIRTIFP